MSILPECKKLVPAQEIRGGTGPPLRRRNLSAGELEQCE